jgi:plasmid stability protein
MKVASIIIRNLPDSVKETLRVRAASHGKALEAEVRDMLVKLASMPVMTPDEVASPQLTWPDSGFPVPHLASSAGPTRADTSRDALYD